MDQSADAACTRFACQHSATTLYHTLPWHNALRAAGFGQPFYLIAMAGDEPVGIFPLMESRGSDGRKRLLSLPATPAAGLLADDPTTCWLLKSRATQLVERRGLDGVWVRTFESASPPGAGVLDDTVLDWVRLPLTAVCEFAAAVVELPDSGVRRARFDSEAARRFRRAGNDLPGALLCALADSPEVTLQAAWDDDGDLRPALGVWTVFNAHVHVLACSAENTSVADCAHLLYQAARDGLARGATLIDFPCPLTPEADFFRLLQSAGVAFARQRRLDLQ